MSRAVFIDRDGTLNVERHYLHDPEALEIFPGTGLALRRLMDAGYVLFIVTNQSGIARGMYSEAQFQELTDWMVERFKEQGVTISKVYHCPHHPDFEPAGERDCDCRKPKPGMILRGIEEFELDPAECIMVGDKPSDVAAAERAGIGTKVRVLTGSLFVTLPNNEASLSLLTHIDQIIHDRSSV